MTARQRALIKLIQKVNGDQEPKFTVEERSALLGDEREILEYCSDYEECFANHIVNELCLELLAEG